MDAVAIREVSKTFGSLTAVDNLTLTVPEGAVYGFIGPNGSGKTTTMRMIVNIFRPDRGSIRVYGEEMTGTRSDRIGYLPEERGVYRRMAVRPLLEFYGELRSGRSVSREVDAWLEKFDLARFASKKLETLSKGMSQKVQFIAAVVPAPKLLVLDEPLTGLDPVSMDLVRASILQLRRQGSTVILSTHDMHVAESMCDSIFMIFRGKKVLDGTMAAIQEQYAADTLRIAADNGAAILNGMPGVEKVRDLGQVQEVRLALGVDSQQVLHSLISRTRVTSFTVSKPSLHDIFVRIAGPAAEEFQEKAQSA